MVSMRLIRDGEKGDGGVGWGGGMEVGGRGRLYTYRYTSGLAIVQELCESRGGRPGLSVLGCPS